jgi:hypothetical protein
MVALSAESGPLGLEGYHFIDGKPREPSQGHNKIRQRKKNSAARICKVKPTLTSGSSMGILKEVSTFCWLNGSVVDLKCNALPT